MFRSSKVWMSFVFVIFVLAGMFGQSTAAAADALAASWNEIQVTPGLEGLGECVLRPPDIPGSTDSDPIPLVDMPLDPGANYYGYLGGLYPDSSNDIPLTHAQAGMERAQAVQPLDVNGQPAEDGSIVFLSVGMSNTSQEFCGKSDSCWPFTFSGQASADPEVSDRIVFYNGASVGQSTEYWLDPAGRNFVDIEAGLGDMGLSASQVQIIWLKVVNTLQATRPSMPDPDADAVLLLTNLGQIVRNLDDVYPNLQQVFVSSRAYGGYSSKPISPEPWAYETGFGIKWLIEAQIDQMETGDLDPCAGDLNYDGEAPWIGWSAYFWANGMEPRSDGLFWEQSDFVSDGIHLTKAGIKKVAGMMMDFFKYSPLTSEWFLAGDGDIPPSPTPAPTATETSTPPAPTPTPTATPAGGGMVNIGDLDGESTNSEGNRWNANLRIYVEDDQGNPVAAATVTGDWKDGGRGVSTCTTGADGWCTIAKTDLRGANATFAVTAVSLPGYTYDPAANADPDGDSNGTMVVVDCP